MIDETIVRGRSQFTGKSMRYSKAFTDALQFMWGEGFLSPGGPDEVAHMLQRDSVLGRRVLDIGSGLGGVMLFLCRDTAPPR